MAACTAVERTPYPIWMGTKQHFMPPAQRLHHGICLIAMKSRRPC